MAKNPSSVFFIFKKNKKKHFFPHVLEKNVSSNLNSSSWINKIIASSKVACKISK